MATLNYTLSLGNQSQLHSSNSVYATAHNAATGTVSGLYTSYIGQRYVSNSYGIYRLALGFDTSDLDDAALIESAYIRFYTKSAAGYTTNVLIKNGAPTYPTIPTPVAADYKIANYSGNGGTGVIPTTVDTSFNVNFNYTGLSWINRTGYSKFLVVGQDDNNSDPPTGEERAKVYTYDPASPSLACILTVVYFIPSNIPVVGDPTYSGTKATYTKATANISDAGGGYEERGFEYGISETPTWAVRETGVWGATGAHSLVLPNLLPLTTSYVRAFVTNDYGTGYSSWTSFTTIDVPSYGLYEEENTATICFYVRKVGGKWSIKHGPYTADQADIDITKILIEGKGKYQVKFESDVLTGISAGVMCKIDIKARG